MGVSGRSLDELPETYGELNHALNRLEGWGLVSLEVLPTREHEYTISPAGEECPLPHPASRYRRGDAGGTLPMNGHESELRLRREGRPGDVRSRDCRQGMA